MREAARSAVGGYVARAEHRDRGCPISGAGADCPRRGAFVAEPGDVEYSDVEDLVVLAARLLGHPAPIRDLGLLGSAAARPMAAPSEKTHIGGSG